MPTLLPVRASLAFLLILAGGCAAQPVLCPSDLLVSNPRVRFIGSESAAPFLDYMAIVDVKNRGTAAQRNDIVQHLDLLLNGLVAGTQAVPGLRAGQSFTATYPFRRSRTKHKPRPPVAVTFHYVRDDALRSGESCTSADDSATKMTIL